MKNRHVIISQDYFENQNLPNKLVTRNGISRNYLTYSKPEEGRKTTL